MNKKIRTIFFFALLLIFLAITPLIIFYSQGYRFDWKQWKVLETGGIYLKTSVPGANVYIDNKFSNRTGQILTYDFLTQNLLPIKHNIKVEKPGYSSWEKNLLIQEKMVTQAYIVLFPEKIELSSLAENISQIYNFPNQDRIIIVDESNQLYYYGSGKKTLLLGLAAKNLGEIQDIVMSPDGSKIIVKNLNVKTKKIKFYTLATDRETLTLTEIKNLNENVDKILFYSNNTIYFTIAKKLYKQSLDTQKQSLVTPEEINDFYLDGDSLYYLQKGNIIRQNLITSNSEYLTKYSDSFNEKTDFQIFVYWDKIFIIENKTNLFLMDSETKILEPLISLETEIKHTEFFDKIIFYNSDNAWLFFLKEYQSPFFVKAESLISLFKDKRINALAWLGGDHFIFLDEKNKPIISELDNRDKINSFFVSADSCSQAWFNQQEKKLYLVSNKNLLVSPKLIP
jgi:hypothetical protein